jgi:hypothetical protein
VLTFYTPIVILNKTNVPLTIGAEMGRGLKPVLKVLPNSSEFLQVEEKVTKLQVKSDTYSWSKPFDITTIGLEGNLQI